MKAKTMTSITDPAREELRAAIGALREVAASQRELVTAVDRGYDLVEEAEAAEQAAEAGLAAARAELEAQTVAALRAGRALPGEAKLADAERKHAQAQEQVRRLRTAARAARAELEAIDLAEAQQRVDAAARAVMFASARPILEAAQAAGQAYGEMLSRLNFLRNCAPVRFGAAVPGDLVYDIDELFYRPLFDATPNDRKASEARNRISAPLAAALEALRTDPDAPLPLM